MKSLDWIVIGVLLSGIIIYGLYRSRASKNIEGYFLSNRSMPWYLVLLSIMGTQASAITFLSGPGQAYADGMRFVQYYFGLPLAMVVICITFVPIFNKLKVVTAYEFLEKRFDNKTRTFTSFLFLLQRGLSTGISIYAPSLIFSSLFGWDIFWTNILMGGLLIIYTVSGGARAVAYTQQVQLVIIFSAMFLAAYTAVKLLPPGVGFSDALEVGGKLGKLNVITDGRTEDGFNWKDRYNIWSGVIGGFFLALSYFGTDQSQVGRYLTAQNNRESRLGLLMNGLVKIPMQFFILLIGVLVFSFYQFNNAPLSFNSSLLTETSASSMSDSVAALQKNMDAVNLEKNQKVLAYTNALGSGNREQLLADSIRQLQAQAEGIRNDFKRISRKVSSKDTNDTNYVFLSFVKNYLPSGLKGLLIAIIFLAAWGSIAAALNSLAASTVVDFHQRFSGKNKPINEYNVSRWYTFGWGLFCIVVAQFAGQVAQSLIEAVNVLGSLFYGVILGIFLVAFYLKRVKSTAIFWAAVVVELYIIISTIWPWLTAKMPILVKITPTPVFNFLNSASTIGFLWLNVIGALGVVAVAWLLQLFIGHKQQQ
ncbi:MAG: sodium:solute symporter [Flavisolibacter sp.]|nr:sodium:solute symporter [Flavisolibacter sp.]